MDAAIWAAARRERRATAYAEAMAALRRWQEMPFLIWERPSSDPQVRFALGKEISEKIADVGFHLTLLRLESPVAGVAYRALREQVRTTHTRNVALAWRTPVVGSDAEMSTPPAFELDDIGPELENCLLAMRRELSWSGFLRRGDTQRRIRAARDSRGRATPAARV